MAPTLLSTPTLDHLARPVQFDPARVNLELAQAVLDAIEADPASYDQADWAQPSERSDCGSAFCVAGHTLHQAGAKFEYTRLTHPFDNSFDRWTLQAAVLPDGDRIGVGQVPALAADLLGLDYNKYLDGRDGASALFFGGNTSAVQQLREICELTEKFRADAGTLATEDLTTSPGTINP